MIEAKARTHGVQRADLRRAKQQARNVVVVLPRGAPITPATRSAALADLSSTPISVELVDPDEDPIEPARYEIAPERFIASHFATVPQLLEVQGGAQPAPRGWRDRTWSARSCPARRSGWVSTRHCSASPSCRGKIVSGRARLSRSPLPSMTTSGSSVGADGHVLQLGHQLAYERGCSQLGQRRAGPNRNAYSERSAIRSMRRAHCTD